MDMGKYDAIIIGIGQAGNPLAFSLAEKGWKVAIIEREYAGGSCINYGCTPTKTMVASAEISHLVKVADEFGIETTAPNTNFKKVIDRRDKIVNQWRDGIEKSLEEDDNIDYFFGEASFVANKKVQVKMMQEQHQEFVLKELTADRIFINVGTSPQIPDIPNLQEVGYLTAKSIMNLKELPEHLLILGGGYIGLEFGQMYRRLGSQVTIIHNETQILAHEDQDVSEALHQILISEGINIHLNARLDQVQKSGNDIKIHLDGNHETEIKGSHLLIATGTNPNTQALNLEKTDIQTDKYGYISVNEYLETAVEGIFSLGDCKGGPEFTHISYDDFRVLSDFLFGEKKRTTKDRMVPYTMFTKPELGRVGYNEQQAQQADKDYKLAKMPMEQVARAIEANKTQGLLKVLIDPETHKILGASCLADIGGEIMSMLQIAMMGNLSYEDLRDSVLAHPTYAETLNNLFAKVE